MSVESIWRAQSNEQIAEDVFEIRLHSEDATPFSAVQPGQFMHLRVANAPQLLLRRPISLHDWDAAAQTVTLQYAVVGEGTKALAAIKTGDLLPALAPIGRGFPLEPSFKKVWLLGGALGTAPLFPIAKALSDAEIHAYLGWKTAAQATVLDRWRAATQLRLYTDDGTVGEKGFALDGVLHALASGERPDVIYACGPEAMYRAMAARLPEDIPCYVSLETRMACGIGACLVCNCKVNTPAGEAHQRVCVDGPVFPLREVVFS